MKQRADVAGSGPGTITPDGCAVDFYRRLSARGEPEIVHAAVPEGASIVEFGCGTGRISTPLAHLGHEVVGVDESPEMLEHCREIRTVCCAIEDLDLDERFDVVLLASHLVNAPEPKRTALLQVARRHLAPGGTVVVQRHRPGWVQTATDTEHDDGEVRSTLTVLDRPEPGRLHARMSYAVGDAVWEHEFTTSDLRDEELPGALAAADLRLGRVLTEDGSWFTALEAASA